MMMTPRLRHQIGTTTHADRNREVPRRNKQARNAERKAVLVRADHALAQARARVVVASLASLAKDQNAAARARVVEASLAKDQKAAANREKRQKAVANHEKDAANPRPASKRIVSNRTRSRRTASKVTSDIFQRARNAETSYRPAT